MTFKVGWETTGPIPAQILCPHHEVPPMVIGTEHRKVSCLGCLSKCHRVFHSPLGSGVWAPCAVTWGAWDWVGVKEPLAVVGRRLISSSLEEIFLTMDLVKTADGLSGCDKYVLSREKYDFRGKVASQPEDFLRGEEMILVTVSIPCAGSVRT